jgi:hypothetical protein
MVKIHNFRGTIVAKSGAAMRHRIRIWSATVLLGLCCVAIASLAIVLVGNRYYYPTDQQRSSFLTAYNPWSAIAPFVDPNNGHQTGSGVSAGAGTRFVTHTVEFDEYFTTQKQNEEAIMAAAEEDLDRRLQLRGVRVLGKQKGANNALHISYVFGPVLGSITLDPLAANSQVHRPYSTLPIGFEDVILHVAIEEKWFPHGTPSPEEIAQIDR